jgi:hypothetical protein
LLLAILFIAGVSPLLRRLWRLWRPDPVAVVYAQAVAEIESGSWSFDPPDGAMGRWPPIEGHIVIERGDATMPDPLQSRTMTDG